jgi:hypothetical protein
VSPRQNFIRVEDGRLSGDLIVETGLRILDSRICCFTYAYRLFFGFRRGANGYLGNQRDRNFILRYVADSLSFKTDLDYPFEANCRFTKGRRNR